MRWGAAGLWTVALVACGASDAEVEGNLGQGVFSYHCIDDGDPSCPDGAKSAATCTGGQTSSPTSSVTDACFPSRVALGTRFRLSYVPNAATSQTGNPQLQVVSPAYLEDTEEGLLRALKPGFAGVYTRSTVNDSLLDYTLVKVVAGTSLELRDHTNATVHLANDFPIMKNPSAPAPETLAVAVLDATGARVAGSLPCTWTSSNPKVVAITTANPASVVTLEAGTDTSPDPVTITATAPATSGLTNISVNVVVQ
jgi:hypothetical protein